MNKLTYKLTNLQRFLIPMDDVIQWLNSHNLKGSVSRYSKYKSYIEDFYKKGNPCCIEDLEIRFKKLNDSVQECAQIVLIYEQFKFNESKGFWEKMKKAINGSVFYDTNSNNMDEGRNFLYELLIATWFSKLGYEIDFDNETDVVAKYGEVTIYAECKRIKSNRSFEENYKKAFKQLEKVEKQKNIYKLVFVDIYNCVAEYLKDYEYPDILTMRKTVKSCLDKYFYIPTKTTIHNLLDKNISKIDAAIFTCRRCLWLNNITPQYCDNIEVVLSQYSSENDVKKNK